MGSYDRVPRLVVETVIGWALIAAGLVMLVTPGPGLVTLLAGVAVLARHYRWAAWVKTRAAARLHDTATELRAHRTARRAGPEAVHGAPDPAPDPQDGADAADLGPPDDDAPSGEHGTSSPTAA
jgi:UPF0716 family protein affecting phage T7 exclusion